MKDLRGSAAAEVAATVEECFVFLAAVGRYPQWYPEVVRSVEVLETDADGDPLRAGAALHVSHGPLKKDFDLLLAIVVEAPVSVRLTRIAHGAGDPERFQVSWRVSPAAAGATLALELEARLAVPRLVPLGGIGEAIAAGFVGAARDALA